MKSTALVVLVIFNFEFLIFNSAEAADTTPPITAVTLNPVTPDGLNNWHKSPLEITLTASDDSAGVKSINWRLDPPAGAWQAQNFSGTLNLAPNSSFEQTSGALITDWVFGGPPNSTGSSDGTTAVSGVKSAKIVSPENGWSGFNHAAVYVPTTPFANLTASAWLKTQNVSGAGAFFKIYALTSQGPVYLTSSSSLTGTNNFFRLRKSFTVSASDAYGVYLDLGLSGVGTVWYDLTELKNTATETQVINTYSSNGSHTLDFYAQDNALNQEFPRPTLTFKIDATAPTNWRDFETERAGNEHTLTAEIKVDDPVSQIDPAQGTFQYSVDGGQTYGYYSDLTKCSSDWVANGWKELNVNLSNGGGTGRLKTPAVNYCNSNWQVCKTIRFKIKDIAGNESSKNVCINGSWIQATGDVASRHAISFGAAGGSTNTDGVVISASGVSNFSSSNNWLVAGYPLPAPDNYASWLARFPTTMGLPSGKLPTTSGRYLQNSSLTISGGTIPSGFSTATFSAVVFVNGNLTINSNLDLSNSAALLFIIAGNVLIDKNVNLVESAFLADGLLDTSYNGNQGEQLVLNGLVAADTVAFNRSLGREAEATAAEKITYQPGYLFRLNGLLGEGLVSWREISP